MTLVERFLKYVSFDTQSNEESGVTPSTSGQMVFAKYLKKELEALAWKRSRWMRTVICSPPFLPIQISLYLSWGSLPTWIQAPI